jgi:hypothetical protein
MVLNPPVTGQGARRAGEEVILGEMAGRYLEFV